ncbi:hypothetical protein BH09MYX1_BH09MYX1_29680 [soil metagenome]
MACTCTTVQYAAMALHDVLALHHVRVVDWWKGRVQGTLAPDAMPAFEIIDHIPKYIREIVEALRAAAGLPAGTAPDESTTAAGHGAQRLRLGFSLDSVVREYGALRDAIVAIAEEDGETPTLPELHVLFDCIIDGIARAVSEYTQQRDAELVRQANEHFAFIAHELRNPLNSASVSLQVLSERGLLPAAHPLVGALERGLFRTSELVDQTLAIAQVASGIQLRRGWTTLKTLFADVEMGSIAQATAKSVVLRVVLEADERMHVDSRLVESALGNLVRNAVKYTSPKSTVELRGSVINERVVIEVEDCCGGLPPGKVEAAFSPFVRLDERQSGFGLGLAIAKQAADAHGGSIRVQNLPGKGCIFVLELPLTK